MRLSVLAPLWTLFATSLAYNCTPYNFPMNGIELPSQNISSADIADKIIEADPEGMGSAHVWGSPGSPVPWKRDENNLFTIPYCFARDFDRENIGHTVEDAIEQWFRKISQASPRSGHGLAMREVVDKDGDPVYCMDSTAVDKWNDKVPYDILPTEYTYGTRGKFSATVGLIRTDPPRRWNMRLSIDGPDLLAETMHELGHVFDQLGLHSIHETSLNMTY